MTTLAESAHEKYFGHRHITTIRATSGWRSLDFGELWSYRELLWVLTARDIKVRYKQTALGAAWALIQPFMLMLVFSLFFGRLARMPSDGIPYPVFSYCALVPWTFFSNALSNSSNSLVGSSHLISKVYFPRLIIPLASTGSWLVDFVIASLIVLGMMLFYHIGFTWHLAIVPVLAIGTLLVALGVGTLLSALTVSYRDFRFLIPFLIQLWMFATPIVYPTSLVPAHWRWLMNLNPLAGLIEGFRCAFLGRPFDFGAIAMSFAIGLVVFIIGIAYFEKVERRFADII